MTPEERARADAINDAISRFAKQRKQPRPKPTPVGFSPIPRQVTPEKAPKTGNAFRYAAVFAIVLAVHIAGFMTYRHYSEAEKVKETARVAEMEAQAAAHAKVTADILAQVNAELARAKAERLNAQLTAQVAQASPKIEYNVYKEPEQAPQRRPTPVTPAPRAYTPPSPEPERRNRTIEHQMIAQAYLAKTKGVIAAAKSIEQVPGWDGRYRTQFEISRNPQQGTSSPRPRRYEVLTQETDGTITAIDVTTKGY